MRIQQVIEAVNAMEQQGVIEAYAIGGAVAATLYVEPVATIDVDIFVSLQPAPGMTILDPQPIFRHLSSQGYGMEGEYVMIGGWPVQFLAPPGPLVEEALSEAATFDVEGVPTRVFTAEHLAAIALQTGRAKDKARLLQFIEEGALDAARFEDIVVRHGLSPSWDRFRNEFGQAGHDL